MNINDVLELIKKKIEAINPVEQKFLVSRGNDNGFERLVPLILEEIAAQLTPNDDLTFTSRNGHYFPDIDVFLNGIKYGIELKSRNNGKWTVNGNSALESITGDGYDEIYVVFGSKVPNKQRILIKYAPYWSATSSIKVTHSPRFTIDMETNDSVFESKEEYNTLRNKSEEEKITFLQKYLKEQSIGSGAKWYISTNETVTPTKFSKLSVDKQNRLRAEMLILFPDDLLIGTPATKYTRTSEYLLGNYFVYNSALRDVFSAGGVYTYKTVTFPKIIDILVTNKRIVKDILNTASPDFFELAKRSWSNNLPQSLITDYFYSSYKNILDYIGENDAYRSKLNKANISNLSDLVL